MEVLMQRRDRVRVIAARSWHGEEGTVEVMSEDGLYAVLQLDGRDGRYHFPIGDLEVLEESSIHLGRNLLAALFIVAATAIVLLLCFWLYFGWGWGVWSVLP